MKEFDDLDQPVRRSLSDGVVDRLRAAIVRGTFEPGRHLSEAALAESFGVSRGPIREAFVTLEHEGLLKLERHRGARVTALSRQDIDEIYQLRLSLERLAIERAARYATAEHLGEMADLVTKLASAANEGDIVRSLATDVAFHDVIYRAADHRRLYQSWAVLRPQIETFLNSRPGSSRTYLAKAVQEHTDLLALIQAHADADAVRMIEQHINSAYERLSRPT